MVNRVTDRTDVIQDYTPGMPEPPKPPEKKVNVIDKVGNFLGDFGKGILDGVKELTKSKEEKEQEAFQRQRQA